MTTPSSNPNSIYQNPLKKIFSIKLCKSLEALSESASRIRVNHGTNFTAFPVVVVCVSVRPLTSEDATLNTVDDATLNIKQIMQNELLAIQAIILIYHFLNR